MNTDSPGPIPHPGVRFPPPFLFAAAFLAAWLLSRRIPLPLLPRGAVPAGEALGIALVAAGIVLMFWGIATFRAHRTAVFPNRPAAHIVRDGPYRFTRNPMYTGMTATYLGLTLTINDVWPLVFLPIALLLLVRLVITREERYLSSAFPSEYAEYRRRVRRWL
jgi:protein-S-isoprenylcysteine O-methyltransferase Ste14